MFVTYLGRELRRRMRQAAFIGLGLAVGVGLVIAVIAASTGVRRAQSSVLHSLYGVGTDITVTKTPTAGQGGPFGIRVRSQRSGSGRLSSGSPFSRDSLRSTSDLGTLHASSVSAVRRLDGVGAAAGALVLTDVHVSGKIPSASSFGAPGSGGPPSFSSIHFNSFEVEGVQLSAGELGPLSSAKIVSGHTFSPSQSSDDVALVDSSYARSGSLHVGSTVSVGGKSFRVEGIVKVPAGDNSAQVYIPLGRAQALSGMSGDVNTIYVAADSAARIGGVSTEISKLLPTATVTNSSTLASQVTGSLSSAAKLADSLGKWLAVAVLVAAFLIASLLTVSAVSRRVREFGTLKALGWRSRRIVGQVVGESVVIGVVGGAVGVGLGFVGATLISHLAGTLTASVGQTTGSATPGGARQFGAPGGGFFGGGNGGAGLFRHAAGASPTVGVHLDASVTVAAVLLAVALAIGGGLVAGAFGGWRAARLRPAAALARVG